METTQKENIMGTMPEGRLLLKLALPMILSVLVSSLYNIVDPCVFPCFCADRLCARIRSRGNGGCGV